MDKRGTKRQYRPYVRRSRQGQSPSGVTAGELLSKSGLAPNAPVFSDRASVEQLERRQMLFSLTVTADDVDPATGIGTARAFFGYAIPYLDTDFDADPQDDDVRTEAFDDEAQGPVGSGAFFLQSGIQVRHNINVPQNIRIAPPGEAQDRYLRVDFNNPAEFFSFQFYQETDAPTNIALARSARFTITPETVPGGDNITGLNTDAIVVSLIRRNEVIANFTGAALRAQVIAGNPALGTGTFNFVAPGNSPGFDTIRVQTTNGVNPAFRVIDAAYTLPGGTFAQLINDRVFGAVATLSGPVGATVSFFDLYGRAMERTIGVRGTGSQFAPLDLDDNGVPDFNDGIGSIRFTGVDTRTNFSLWGGTIEQTDDPQDADFFEGGFAFTIVGSIAGFFDDFEATGFGYVVNRDGDTVDVGGLPAGPGSVIVGSPFVRPLPTLANPGAYNPAGRVPGQAPVVQTGFTRADQGLFVDGNQSIGSVYVHGILHGSSRFSGTLDRLYAGYLVGTVRVEGDAGMVMSGSEAGQWSPEPDFPITDPAVQLDPVYKTGAELTVGRSLGELIVGGRSLLDVTVVGDLNSPITRPSRDAFTYYEKEFIFGTSPDGEEIATIRANQNNTGFGARQASARFRGADFAYVLGTSYFRNDTIMGAEVVNGTTSGVRIKGELSGQDPVNGEDAADVFAIIVDGTQEIVIEGSNDTGELSPYFRIVDERGRTLAAPQAAFGRGNFQVTQVKWRPTAPGVYYVVVSDPNGAEDDFANSSYTLAITGLVPVTFGSYRTGAGSGFTDLQRGLGNAVTLLNGSMGTIRVGVGVLSTDGEDATVTSVINTDLGDDDVMSFQGGTFTIPGSLYEIMAGGDIGAPGGAGRNFVDVFVGGDLGQVLTGLHPAVSGGSGEGDLNFLNLNIGGRIGQMLITGGIGMDQDNTDPLGIVGQDLVNIRTGLSGGRGDIGLVRVGAHVGGNTLTVRTSPGSTIGAFLLNQDVYGERGDRNGIYNRNGLQLFTGPGSDIRFLDYSKLDLRAAENVRFPLIGGTPLEFIDDAGARVRISVGGADGIATGFVHTLAIDGSQGVAIARIEVDLSGGRVLDVTGSNVSAGGVVGIGRIVITAAGGGSAVRINGNVEIDTWLLTSAGPLAEISNNTPGGDFVAIDVAGLGSLDIRGDLGRTQTASWGPSLLGPFLGINGAGFVGAVGGALGTPSGFELFDSSYNGDVFRPIADDDFADDNAYLDDVGGPFDGWLNGLVVRGGSVLFVNAGGVIGDVILQGDTAAIVDIRANSDGLAPLGRFEGIVGNIFAFDIGTVDLGDGLLSGGPSPLPTSGIFAVDDIQSIRSSSTRGVTISGVINAANFNDPDVVVDSRDGINGITLNNATIAGAWIGSSTIDGYWISFNYNDENRAQGDITDFGVNGGTFFRNTVFGRRLGSLNLSGVVYDASTVSMTEEIGDIRAQSFRNSTLDSDLLAFRENLIETSRDARTISAVGDMTDLRIAVNGAITSSLSATNMARVTVGVANRIAAINVTRDLLASSITSGRVENLNVARNIRASTLSVSGPLDSVVAESIVNTAFNVTGPDGSVGTVVSRSLLSGSFNVTGPIASITAGGDMRASITTTTARGNVGTLTAGGSLDITTDISGTLSALTANGGNIGSRDRRGTIVVRGDLVSATAPLGQLYADLRVGGNITNRVLLGGAVNKPGNSLVGQGSIVAFGRVNAVTVLGDFDGDIISYSGGLGTIAITNGSFLAGNTIAAFDGDITSLTITNGSLYGDVFAGRNITALRVVAGAGGAFGDVGVNPARSSGVAVDALRNQLPPGVLATGAVNGPRISAGQDIVNIAISGGSVFESSFVAGRTIRAITITGSVLPDGLTGGFSSVFAAGDSIDAVTITGSAQGALFLAGLSSFGADNRPGGLGVNADTVKNGSIGTVTIRGGLVNTTFVAGVTPGADGLYGTVDDRAALGPANITTLAVSGTVTGGTVVTKSASAAVSGDARFTRIINPLSANVDIDTGVGTPGVAFTGTRTFDFGGSSVTFALQGPGQAFFDAVLGRLTLRGTTIATNLTVTSPLATISNLDITTGTNASLNSLTIRPNLAGDSDITIDGDLRTLALAGVAGTGAITVGGNVNTATFGGGFLGGFFRAANVTTLRITGDYGAANPSVVGEARIDALSIGALVITGTARGAVSVDRDIASASITGSLERATIRAGGAIGSLAVQDVRLSFVSAGNDIGTATVRGEMFDSIIASGLDLGVDGVFGGVGANADVVSAGSIGAVTVGGNFRESDVVAGVGRGPDGYFGTADDLAAPGRSTIGSVAIGGNQVGSTRLSESYRIAASGLIGPVTLGGQAVQSAIGNFAVAQQVGQPAPIQVRDIAVTSAARVFTAALQFNQGIDFSSLSAALSVSEVRGSGDIEIRLIEGVDYSLSYTPETNTARVVFSRAITDRNLPQVAGTPGPGVYRFTLSQSLLRGRVAGATLDGNGDGLVGSNDNFAGHAIVGDAGDKFAAESLTAGTGSLARRVDFYAPTNLDLVLDNAITPDGVAEINRTFTLRGSIGDHPDNDVNVFRFGSDADLYSVTLQAGQILRLGALQGAAQRANVTLVSPTQQVIGRFTDAAEATALPISQALQLEASFPQEFLIKQTGRYVIVIGNLTPAQLAPGSVPNIEPVPGGVGDYSLSVQVFDDGDSGFTATTDAGDGALVVNAPAPIAFAGPDGVFNTADDLPAVVIEGFTFTLNRGADGAANTADDVVSGINNATGADAVITSTRTGTGRQTSVINGSIGLPGFAGIPGSYASDVDVYHLNGRFPIAPGTKMRATVKLTELGSDLGSATAGEPAGDQQRATFNDDRGSVQLALFDTSRSTSTEDATMVFSPTDFKPVGGQAARVIADNGSTRYGYDANGDFFIEFVVPGRLDQPGQAGTFALAIQGVFNGDYQLEIVTDGTGTITPVTQNVLIETGGGVVNWLLPGGESITVSPFTSRVLGFSGSGADGVTPIDQVITQQLVGSLNSLFQNAFGAGLGFNVRFSTNPADFEFQPFSTVYLSNAVDPLTPIFDAFASFNFGALSETFFSTQPYGFSQRSDPMNANQQDEAVVFVPSLALLGYSGGLPDVDGLVQSLTGAVSRRVGELMGLRISAPNADGATTFDPLASNSVSAIPGPGRAFTLSNVDRDLSNPFDAIRRTDFFVGRQNAVSLLDRVLTRTN